MSTMTIGTTKASLPKGPDQRGWFWGTGRRKTATARVRVKPGAGEFLVNERPMDEYFLEDRDRKAILGVLEKTGHRNKMDVRVTCAGAAAAGSSGSAADGRSAGGKSVGVAGSGAAALTGG